MGIITNTENYTVILPVFFAIMPLMLIDKPKRIISYMIAMYLIVVALILAFKGTNELAINDIINCTLFLAIGLLSGNVISNIRLSNIQMRAELIKRESIDFLTNLPNRRKLFDQAPTLEKIPYHA